MQGTAPSVERLTDELLLFLGHLMKTTQGGVYRVAGELDLTLSQLRALFVIAYCGHRPALSELASEIDLSVPATGRVVDALVRMDLASRSEDEADRRIKRLALTPHGEEILDRIGEARREGLRRFVEQLDDDAREQFSRALHLIPADLGCAPGTPIHGDH